MVINWYSVFHSTCWLAGIEVGEISPMNHFEFAFYWFMSNPTVVRFVVGVCTVMAIAVSVLLVLRKWGDFD